ncbi:MAG: YdiU family protein [Planctomycetota bacterium]|nr:MAG: YdiU family protein [Planctomycetota bacterium]
MGDRSIGNPGWKLEATYASLPGDFFQELPPQTVREPELLLLNEGLAQDLGLDAAWLRSGEGLAVLAGNALPADSRPLAQAYCGHQFGHFTMLGDGRAILIGEQRDAQGSLWDLQYKGSGRTPYSRGGDGRAALKPMLREFLISEAMHGLGIPTTRSLAVVATGEEVLRQTGPEPGAVMLRVASSHLRVGTFQYAAAKGNAALSQALLGYAIARHYPACAAAKNPAEAFLEAVIQAQAGLIARWMLVGFIHGVMNTDNMTISGESIDYGPCAFMDAYYPQTVFSSIDHHGRYAYGNQPSIAQWNLARLAETLLPLLSEDEQKALALANASLRSFGDAYRAAWLAGMRGKLGLANAHGDDQALCDDFLEILLQQGRDFTNSFRDLSLWLQAGSCPEAALAPWFARWQERIASEGGRLEQVRARMARHNPRLIPRNHRVEEALEQAEAGNWQAWDHLLAHLRQPYGEAEVPPGLAEPVPEHLAAVYQTFCGT